MPVLGRVARARVGGGPALALALAALSIGAPSAVAAPLGTDSVQSSRDTNTPGNVEAFRAIAGSTATVTKLHVYLDAANSARTVQTGIYNGSTKPGTKLAGCTISTPVVGWNVCSLPSGVAVSRGTTYWLAVLQPRSAAGTLRFRVKSTGGASYASSTSSFTALPSSFKPGTKYPSSPVSVFADNSSANPAVPSAPTAPPAPTNNDDPPVVNDPGIDDPAPSDPAPSSPAPSDPAPSSPAPSEPAPSDPTPSDPAPSDPTPSDPAPSDPTPSDPAPSNPTTPTATSNCMPDPSKCGYPDVESVGVTPGTQLTAVSGVVTLGKAGQVYENKVVTGSIVVTAPNVTIRNVRLIDTDPYYAISVKNQNSWENTQANLTLDHVEINMNGKLNIKGIAFNGYTARNVFFHNGADCAHMGENVTIQDSLCVDGPDANNDGMPDSTAFCNGTDHFDGFQSDGGNNILVRHNTLRNPCSQTSNILLSSNTSHISNATIDNNLLAGGGYSLYCAGMASAGTVTNIIATNNRFARSWYSTGGYWGPTAYCEYATKYSGNVWDDTGKGI
jgi:hypothetical protein